MQIAEKGAVCANESDKHFLGFFNIIFKSPNWPINISEEWKLASGNNILHAKKKRARRLGCGFLTHILQKWLWKSKFLCF